MGSLVVLRWWREAGVLGVLSLASGVIPAAYSPLAAQAAPATGAQSVTAFVGVTVIPMDQERVLPEQTVLVRGERIEALGPVDQVRVPPEAVRIDGRGKFLLPGLADMHVHLPRTLLSKQPELEQATSEKLEMAERALLLLLAHGVTTARNMIGEPWHVGLRERIARGELWGPHLYTAGPALNGSKYDGSQTPDAAVKIVEGQKAAGYDFIKMYDGWPDRAVFDTVVATAKRLGMPLAGHAPNLADSAALDQAIGAGYHSLEHLHGFAAYLDRSGQELNAMDLLTKGPQNMDEAKLRTVAATMGRAGVWNVPTLTLLAGGMGGFFQEPVPAGDRAAFARQVIQALQKAGAGLLLGTDAAYCSEEDSGIFLTDTSSQKTPWVVGFTLHYELETLVRAGGLTPYQALETSTRNVAAFFGTLAHTGTVAVDKQADLVLLAGNPLVDLQYINRPVGVMLGGRWLPREAIDARLAEFKMTDAPASATCSR